MPVTAVALGTGQTAAGTTVPITCLAAVPVGALVTVEMAASSNTCTPGCADSQGNVWQQTSQPLNPGTALQASVFYSVITTALTTSDTITAYNGNVTSAHIQGRCTSFTTPNGWLGTSATVGDRASKANGASSTSLTCAATPATTQNDELVIGVFFSTAVTSTFTVGGAGIVNPNAAISDGNEIGWSEYYVTSGIGTQTPTATQSFAGSNGDLCVTFKVALPPFTPRRMPLGA